LSNALSVASQPASAPASNDTPDVLVRLILPIAAGCLLALIWLVRRIAYPAKASLQPSPGRANRVHPVLLIAIFLLVTVVTRLTHPWLSAWLDGPDRVMVSLVLIGQGLLLIAGVVVGAMFFRRGLARGCGLTLRHWRADGVRGGVAWLISLPICLGLLKLTALLIVLAARVAEALGLPAFDLEGLFAPPELLEMLTGLPAAWRVAAVASAVVLTPIAEELFFRGLVQSSIRRLSGRPWVGIVITAGVFAIAHGQIYGWPALFALAVILGYNYERTGRLLAPILTHALFNATFIYEMLSRPT